MCSRRQWRQAREVRVVNAVTARAARLGVFTVYPLCSAVVHYQYQLSLHSTIKDQHFELARRRMPAFYFK